MARAFKWGFDIYDNYATSQELRYASARIVVQMIVIVAKNTPDECCNQFRRCEVIVDEERYHQQ